MFMEECKVQLNIKHSGTSSDNLLASVSCV